MVSHWPRKLSDLIIADVHQHIRAAELVGFGGILVALVRPIRALQRLLFCCLCAVFVVKFIPVTAGIWPDVDDVVPAARVASLHQDLKNKKGD